MFNWSSGRLLASGAILLVLICPSVAQSQGDWRPHGSRIEGKTAVERAIGKCVGAVVGGALVGALIGRAVSKKGAGEGALIGAGAGSVVCAVLMSAANKKDKERLRTLQLQALNSGTRQTDSWRNDEGQVMTATITPAPVKQVAAPKGGTQLMCTTVDTALTANSTGAGAKEVTCLVGDTWVTGDKLKPYGLENAQTV